MVRFRAASTYVIRRDLDLSNAASLSTDKTLLVSQLSIILRSVQGGCDNPDDNGTCTWIFIRARVAEQGYSPDNIGGTAWGERGHCRAVAKPHASRLLYKVCNMHARFFFCFFASKMTDTWQNEIGNIKVNDRGMRVAQRDGQEELLLEGQVCDSPAGLCVCVSACIYVPGWIPTASSRGPRVFILRVSRACCAEPLLLSSCCP